MSELVLGPLVRHVDTDSACVWVETDTACEVVVTAGEARASAPTFRVHGHHYALVEVAGLPAGEATAYVVGLRDLNGEQGDGRTVWPSQHPSYDGLPAPVLATLDPDKPLRLAFGSCRTSVGHDEAGNKTHGVDAMRAYALRMAQPGTDDEPAMRWPDLLLLLGDQVYADETTEEMREFIRSRRDIEQPPGHELKDYEEYAHLYRLAWSDPANRWLLSTLPTLMIFDDHDIRDDWNTSQEWREDMARTSWWHGRIVAGLASYWVYQHLGNMTREERDADEIWQRVDGHDTFGGEGELDLSDALDAFAERADEHPESYRWSYVRQLGDQARLVMVDCRAARMLKDGERALLDDAELDWLDHQLQGDVDHLLVGSSLPFLLAPGVHHAEAFGEALAGGVWGPRLAARGEQLRRAVDLEHWAAFQDTFQRVARMVVEVATGRRGRAPRTITFLSGDVHHSYLSEATVDAGGSSGQQRSRILQAVCSPIRNPLSRNWRIATAVLSYGVAAPVGHVLARAARVGDAPVSWDLLRGPWFENNLATLEVEEDGLRLWWATGSMPSGDEAPTLRTAADVRLRATGSPDDLHAVDSAPAALQSSPDQGPAPGRLTLRAWVRSRSDAVRHAVSR